MYSIHVKDAVCSAHNCNAEVMPFILQGQVFRSKGILTLCFGVTHTRVYPNHPFFLLQDRNEIAAAFPKLALDIHWVMKYQEKVLLMLHSFLCYAMH